MVRLLRHRQTKGAVTDRPNLRPPRHILTLPFPVPRWRSNLTGSFRLRPVTFRYKKDFGTGDARLQYGLIAEEVAEVYPELVVNDEAGQARTVEYQKLNVMLLNELQKQSQQIRILTKRLTRLEEK